MTTTVQIDSETRDDLQTIKDLFERWGDRSAKDAYAMKAAVNLACYIMKSLDQSKEVYVEDPTTGQKTRLTPKIGPGARQPEHRNGSPPMREHRLIIGDGPFPTRNGQ